MYPPLSETDHAYADHSSHGHGHPPQGQGYVLQMPSYGMPVSQPYAPPYISTSSRGIPRTHHWSTGLCRCLDDPGICKNHVASRFIHLSLKHVYIMVNYFFSFLIE